MGTVVDRKLKCRAKVIQVIKNIINSFGAEIGSALGAKLGSILGIALGIELGTALGSELGTAKSKMNISVPPGNRRLWQEEDMIAFVGSSSLTVSATDTVGGFPQHFPRSNVDVNPNFITVL
jgi:hypothetical protein